jgi:hypothetical protein
MKEDLNELVEKLNEKIKTLDIEDNDKKELIKLVNNINLKKNKKIIKTKDPNLPKRPKNTFMHFMEDIKKIKDNKKPSANFPSNKLDNVKSIINNNTGKAIVNLTKDCGELWKTFTNDDKVKYENNYKKIQDKYKKGMEKYKKQQEQNTK